jgi:hypothetical protein
MCICTLSDKIVVAVLIMGLPQGGLNCGWNCAMNGLLEQLRKTKTHCKAFADDGALITRGNKLKDVMIDAQKAINVAVERAREMGVEFSAEKTVVMLFTTKRPTSYQMPARLRLYGQSTPFSKTAKYLVVTMDDKSNWKPHIENKIKKAKRSLMAVRSVIGQTWGPSPACARWSWTSVVRPALTYGSIV